MVRRIVGISALLALLAFAVGAGLLYRSDLTVEEIKTRDPGVVTPSSRFVSVSGQSIHYRDQGKRETKTILLLHDDAVTIDSFGAWAKALGQYRLITLDLPGQGLTGAGRGAAVDSSAAVSVLQAFRQSLGLENMVLVGNGRGGEIALRFALAQPEAVSHLVLIAPTGTGPAAPAPRSFFARLADISLITNFVRFLPMDSYAEGALRRAYFDDARVTEKHKTRAALLLRRTGNRRALFDNLSRVPYVISDKDLASIETPLLVIWGAEDEIVPAAQALHLADTVSGAQIIVFPQTGHLPQEEAAADSAALFASFLLSAPDRNTNVMAGKMLGGERAPPLRPAPLKPVETAPLAPIAPSKAN